jgi:pilus assembly protein TadC
MTSISLALCLLSAAVWFAAGPRRAAHSARAARSVGRTRVATGSAQRGASRIALRTIAAVASAVALVVTLGPRTGLVVAAVIAPLAVLLVGRLHARPSRLGRAGRDGRGGDARRVPLLLDLLAAALRGGQPVASAVAAVAGLGGAGLEPRLRRVAGLLRLGAHPAEAWGSLEGSPLATVAATACRSAESGIRLARSFELLAAELRDEVRAAALARAHRAGVWALLPLGLCFLPAFACLGVIPVIVGIAHGVLNGAIH